MTLLEITIGSDTSLDQRGRPLAATIVMQNVGRLRKNENDTQCWVTVYVFV